MPISRGGALPARSEPVALSMIRLGLLLCGVLALRAPILGSEGFIIPKLCVLVASGFLSALLLIVHRNRIVYERADALLILVLGLLLAAWMNATNRSYAAAGVGSLTSSLLLFWVARSLAHQGRRHALLIAAVSGIGVIVGLGLVEAYTGIELSPRSPGGTLGNRNRLAHLAVVSLPALALLTVRVRRMLAVTGFTSLIAMSSSLIVLSRSRGAWVAGLVLLASACGSWLFRLLVAAPHGPRPQARVLLIAFALAGGAALALVVPNRLEWISETPYRDSFSTLTAFRTGSGAGRLLEFHNTVRMIADQPFLGVGPGNWRIAYPRYATPDDPNVDGGIEPVRRYPQSEWLGSAAERGLISMAAMLFFFGILFWRWCKVIAAHPSGRHAAHAGVGVCICAAVIALGIFDPVIQTPVAGFVVPVMLGTVANIHRRRSMTIQPGAARAILAIVLALTGAILINFRVREVWASCLYAYRPTLEKIETAAQIDPENYFVRYLAASTLAERGDCRNAASHIVAARRLYPTASAVDSLEAWCRDHGDGP